MRFKLPVILGFLISAALCGVAQQTIQGTTAANTPAAAGDRAVPVTISPNSTGLPGNAVKILTTQSNFSTGSVTSLVVTLSINPTIGSTLVIGYCSGNTTNPAAPITDTYGSLWVKAAYQAGTFGHCGIWFAENSNNTSEAITVSPGTAASITAKVWQLTGLLSFEPVQADVTTSASGNSGTASAPAVSPYAPLSLMVSMVGIGTATQTMTAGTGWTFDVTSLTPSTPSGLFGSLAMSQQLDDVQRIQPSATFTSEPWAIVAAVFHTPILPVGGTFRHTDGNGNYTPAMDAAARAGFQQVTDGTNNAAVKPASTAATATDPALVVSLSPNSPVAGTGNFNNAAVGNTGSAPPASASLDGGVSSGATGGLMVGIPVCDSYAVLNVSTATTTLGITGVSGRQVRICALHLVTALANNVAIIEGTGATCGTNTTGMAGGTTAASGYNLAANGGLTLGSGIGTVMRTATAGESVCIVTSAATQLSGGFSYAIY